MDDATNCLANSEVLSTNRVLLGPRPQKPARKRSAPRRRRTSPPQPPVPRSDPGKLPAQPAPGRTADVLALDPTSPFRSPSWRWQLAVYQLDRGVDLPFGDAWVGQAMRFLPAMRGCQGDDERRQLVETMPEIYRAHALFVEEPADRRWVTEALLLAGVPLEEVASRMHLSSQALACFVALFFDVLDRLDARSYVVHNLLRLHPNMDPDVGNILRAYGYNGGPLVLGCLVRVLLPHFPWSGDERPDNFLKEEPLGALLIKANVAARLLPVTADTAPTVLRLNLALVEGGWGPGRRPQSEDELRNNLTLLLTEVQSILEAEGVRDQELLQALCPDS